MKKKEINSAQSCEILNTQRSARADYSLLHKTAMPEATRRRLKKNAMSNQIQIQQQAMLEAINRTEIDMQIATAKRYPRDTKRVLERIRESATEDITIAQECFYSLPRDGKSVEGISVRMAEIMAGAWGNLRVQTRVIGNDGKTITAQGICHDLETNVAVSVEVKRSIVNKYGKTYSEDMQVTTGNAASAIAFRNAVLKIIPKATTNKTIEEVKKVAMGKMKDLKTSREQCVEVFKQFKVTEEMLCELLEVEKISDINQEQLFTLRGLYNAIKEGTTTIEEAFQDVRSKSQAKSAMAKAQEAKAKAQAAMNKNVVDAEDAVIINDKEEKQ
jgi:hypothetical protein